MKIRKLQIALQLFPELSDNPRMAVQKMRRWIKGDPELQEKLIAAGFKSKKKYITKKQANLVMYYLE